MERLVKYDILQDLQFSDFNTCVDYIKGKLTTKVRKSELNRCTNLLDLIHIDICGPFTFLAMGGFKYFITFIDDFSHYGHVDLIREKSDSLEAFKAFKARVELEKGNKTKTVNSNKGDEYYGKYDETEHNPKPFARYLQDCGIDVIYTMTGTPK